MGDGSKVWCCKEQYCIGTWNVRSMNQGKFYVVKQEMARVNIDILGISELKWTGMDEFNSDDHYVYYCRGESLRKNGVAIIVNRRVQSVSNREVFTLMQSRGVPWKWGGLCLMPASGIHTLVLWKSKNRCPLETQVYICISPSFASDPHSSCWFCCL